MTTSTAPAGTPPAVAGSSGAAGAPAPVEDRMTRFADEVRDLSTSDRALLRRLYLVQSSFSRSYQADGVVVGLLHRAEISMRDDEDESWKLIAHVGALLVGTGTGKGDGARGRTALHSPHDRRRPVGAALAMAGYSKTRLLRLTAVRGSLLADQIVRAARVLAGSDLGQGDRRAVNLWTLFDLVGADPAKAETARRDIARSYY